jgi:hypothetical protein
MITALFCLTLLGFDDAKLAFSEKDIDATGQWIDHWRDTFPARQGDLTTLQFEAKREQALKDFRTQLAALAGKKVSWTVTIANVTRVTEGKTTKLAIALKVPKRLTLTTQRPKENGKQPLTASAFGEIRNRFVVSDKHPLANADRGSVAKFTATIAKAYYLEGSDEVSVAFSVNDWALTAVKEDTSQDSRLEFTRH